MYYLKLMQRWLFGYCPHWWSNWSKPVRDAPKSLCYYQHRYCLWCGRYDGRADAGDIGDWGKHN